MIHISDKSKCCGCGACAQICPVHIIQMKADEEGFLYPTADRERCISCGACERVCPVLNAKKDSPYPQNAYVCQLRDRTVLAESTSGGVFSAIASYVFRRGGVVFGSVLREDYTVVHCKISAPEELYKLRGSKYVQSEIGTCFREAKEELKKGKIVLFSGTPCQIEGLLNYFGEDTANLLTVDLVCHAVPSPLIWDRYTQYRKAQDHLSASRYSFRDKTPYGYQLSVLSAHSPSRQIYHGDISVDPYLRAFFSNICDRPSCYDCAFKKRYRRSDFTLWDCLDIQQFCTPPDSVKPGLGVSSVLIHSEKGRALWTEIEDQLISVPVDPDALADSSKELTHSVPANEKRSAFLNDALNLSPEHLFQKYFPTNGKKLAEHAVRVFLARLGVTAKARFLAKRFIKTLKR